MFDRSARPTVRTWFFVAIFVLYGSSSHAQNLPDKICVASGSSHVTCGNITINIGASQAQIDLLNRRFHGLSGLTKEKIDYVAEELKTFEANIQSALDALASAQGSLFQRDEQISQDLEDLLASLVTLAGRQAQSEANAAYVAEQLATLTKKQEEIDRRLGRVAVLSYSPQRWGMVGYGGIRVEGEAIGFGQRSQPLTLPAAFGLGIQFPLGSKGWSITWEAGGVCCTKKRTSLPVVSGDPDSAVLARGSAKLDGYALGTALSVVKEWGYLGVGGRMGARLRDLKWKYDEPSIEPDVDNPFHAEFEAALAVRLRLYEGIALSVLPGLIVAPTYQPAELLLDAGGLNPTLAPRELAVYPTVEARIRIAISGGQE